MPLWHRACALEDLPPERPVAFEVGGRRLVIVRHDDRIHALDARCPHAAGPLARGWLEADTLVCPLHYWRFRLTDGRCTTVADQSIATYPCALRETEVWVEL
jgi:nitrite reductase/ring-hydroxylating ferredoxin subunit